MPIIDDNENEPFQEHCKSPTFRKNHSFFLLIVQGIHVFSIVSTLLGSIPYVLLSIPILYHLFRGVEPNYPESEFWGGLHLSYIGLLPLALFLYFIGRGLGKFIKNERIHSSCYIIPDAENW